MNRHLFHSSFFRWKNWAYSFVLVVRMALIKTWHTMTANFVSFQFSDIRVWKLSSWIFIGTWFHMMKAHIRSLHSPKRKISVGYFRVHVAYDIVCICLKYLMLQTSCNRYKYEVSSWYFCFSLTNIGSCAVLVCVVWPNESCANTGYRIVQPIKSYLCLFLTRAPKKNWSRRQLTSSYSFDQSLIPGYCMHLSNFCWRRT